jgi:hypothetical protein
VVTLVVSIGIELIDAKGAVDNVIGGRDSYRQ